MPLSELAVAGPIQPSPVARLNVVVAYGERAEVAEAGPPLTTGRPSVMARALPRATSPLHFSPRIIAGL
jgi:hypothetical protein